MVMKELFRQLIHASGVFIVVLGYFISPDSLILLAALIMFLVVLLFELDKKYQIPIFSYIFKRCKRRDDERGFIYFFLGIILTLIIFKFNMPVANAAILILLFGDSASTIIGRKYGKTRIPFKKDKTVEGSLAFFMVGLTLALTQVPLLPAFLGVLAGVLAEAYSPIDDNIPIPLVSATVMALVIYVTI
jgi:dolichol kinase